MWLRLSWKIHQEYFSRPTSHSRSLERARKQDGAPSWRGELSGFRQMARRALIAVEDLHLWRARCLQCIGRLISFRSARCLACFPEQEVSLDARGQSRGLLAHLFGVECKSILQRQESPGWAPLLHLYRSSPDCSGTSVPTRRPPSQISSWNSPTRPWPWDIASSSSRHCRTVGAAKTLPR